MGAFLATGFFSFLMCCVVFVAQYVQPVYVKLNDGTIIYGKKLPSPSSSKFYAFRGIPYAQPPINELRFQPPQPLCKKEKVICAYAEKPMCMQKDYLFYDNPEIEGSEDCLYLNVYTPEYPTRSNNLPVMVYIHHGGWVVGTGNSNFNGPELFMDRKVALVTFNYRLGIFGTYVTQIWEKYFGKVFKY